MFPLRDSVSKREIKLLVYPTIPIRFHIVSAVSSVLRSCVSLSSRLTSVITFTYCICSWLFFDSAPFILERRSIPVEFLCDAPYVSFHSFINNSIGFDHPHACCKDIDTISIIHSQENTRRIPSCPDEFYLARIYHRRYYDAVIYCFRYRCVLSLYWSRNCEIEDWNLTNWNKASQDQRVR